jgi:hypothetical protein
MIPEMRSGGVTAGLGAALHPGELTHLGDALPIFAIKTECHAIPFAG